MEALLSFQTSVNVYQSARRNIQENLNQSSATLKDEANRILLNVGNNLPEDTA